MKYIYTFMALVMISLLALAGCQQASTTPPATSDPSATPLERTFTDDTGRSVTIKGLPQRIISLSPSNTEIAFALGLGDKIIGVTTYDNYPEAALSKPKVSEFSEVDVEKIVELQPDLILASDIHRDEVVPALEKLGIPVVIVKPGSIEDIWKSIRLVGDITGKSKEAGELVSSLENRVQVIAEKTAKLPQSDRTRVFYVTWHDPFWTAGGDTIVSDLVTRAVGSNIADDLSGYAVISLETIIERNPQVILVMSSMGELDTSFNYVKQEPRLQVTDALKDKRVYIIDADIFGRTTPRIVDGLEELVRLIHPELGQ